MKELKKAMLEKRIELTIWVVAILLSILFLAQMIVQENWAVEQEELRIVELNGGWDWIHEDGTRESVRIPATLPASVEETVRLHRTISNSQMQPISIMFMSAYQRIQVRVNGEIIYTRKNYKTRARDDAPASGWNFIEFPRKSMATDKEDYNVELIFSSPYSQYAGVMPRVYEGNYSELKLYLYLKYKGQNLLDIWLSILGGCLIIYAHYFIRYRKNYRCIIYLGCFAVTASVWFRTGTTSLPLHYIGPYSGLILSFAAFLLMPIFAIMFLKNYELEAGYELDVLWALFIADYLLMFALQLLGVADLIELIRPTHVLLLLTFLAVLFKYFQGIICYKQQKNFYEICGVVVFVICALWEIIQFYVGNGYQSGIYVRFGTMFFILSLAISTMIQHEKEENTKIRNASKMQKLRTKLMISQIQPHFIFNTLGAIRIMTKTDPDTAYQMVYDFSKYLRANLNSLENEKPILFSEELNHIKAYANIEQIRFANFVDVRYEIAEKVFYVPPLSIQPLVENAIRHGLRKGKRKGTVIIRSYMTDNEYCIEVEDNGVGFIVDEYQKEVEEDSYIIGIRNIRYRLKSMMNATMEIRSELGEGSCITLHFPIKKGIGTVLDEYNIGG